MSVVALLSVIKRFWWAPVIGVLVFVVANQRHALARKDATITHVTDVMTLNTERVKTAGALYEAAAQRLARRIETAQTQATQEASVEIEDIRGRADALAAAYIRLRNAAKGVGGGASGAGQGGGSTAATGAANGAGGMSELDDADLQICTENTIRAIGWRAWWLKIMAIPRD